MSLPAACIHRLRVPARIARRADTRATFERWLAGRDVTRYGFPPSAIVLVRRLATRWSAVCGAAREDDPLAALARDAVRPAAVSHVPAGAGVVWFADEAELLACIARDAMQGAIAVNWWWRLVFHRGLDHGAAVERWAAGARAMPRAVKTLEAIGLARAWLAMLPPHECARLTQALAREFPIAGDVARYIVHGAKPLPSIDVPASGEHDEAVRVHGARVPHLVPPDVSTPGHSVQARLHRLCLALADDPVCAIDAGYVERDIAIAIRASSPFVTHEAASVELGARPPTVHPQALTPIARAERVMAETRPSTPRVESTHAMPEPPAISDAPVGDASPRDIAAPEYAGAATPEVTHERPVDAQRLASASEDAHPYSFETRYGGLLFVLNAALQLGYYGDFTQPLRRGLACPPWRFLLLVGRAIGGRGFARDPLAAWLADKARAVKPGVKQRRVADREVRLLLPQLRDRLAQALDLAGPRRLSRVLLKIAARVEVSPDRLDAHYALAVLPLSIRYAGLDRDPGWIPAAGCDVRFHFA